MLVQTSKSNWFVRSKFKMYDQKLFCFNYSYYEVCSYLWWTYPKFCFKVHNICIIDIKYKTIYVNMFFRDAYEEP